jgi:hypothetical protein
MFDRAVLRDFTAAFFDNFFQFFFQFLMSTNLKTANTSA